MIVQMVQIEVADKTPHHPTTYEDCIDYDIERRTGHNTKIRFIFNLRCTPKKIVITSTFHQVINQFHYFCKKCDLKESVDFLLGNIRVTYPDFRFGCGKYATHSGGDETIVVIVT